MRTDWELLEQWRDGSNAAGSELLARYGKPIARFFANKVSLREDVPDLVSQTFLACVQQRDKIRDPQAFRAYLFGVAMNRLRLYIANKCRQAREETDFAAVCVSDITPTSMTSIVVRRREAMLVLQALRELPLEQQIVLELKFIEDASGSEISELLAIPEGTVRSRLRIGLQHLKDRVGQLASSPDEQTSTLSDLAAWARSIRTAMDDPGEEPR